tara:strand:+ start:8599 stop:9687 length:1089 start_codon:yes stop_codon:yes gene_type:complete
MSILGSLFLADLRIFLYWVPFFIVLFFGYLHNKNLLHNNIFYRKNLNYILYISGLIYFIFYLIMNLLSLKFFGNEYEIQNNFWIGSSAAFHIASIFLSNLYILWQQKNFKINSYYFLSSILFTFVVSLNSSRLGYLYLIIFFLITIIKCLTKKLFLNILIILTVISNTYFYTSTLIASNENENLNLINTFGNITRSATSLNKVFNRESKVKLSGDDDRIFELMVGIKKFQKINSLSRVFGTGWYSSRKTINNVRDEIINNYSNRLTEFKGIKPNSSSSLQGIVSLILDTGILGTSFFALLYFLSFKKIISTTKDLSLKLLLISMLGMNAFCLLIGYPFANVAYWLIFLPGGIFTFNQNLLEN